MFTLVMITLYVNQIPLIVLLNFSFILFFIGMVGIVWNKKNFLILLFCIELTFFSISLNFIFFTLYLFNNLGQLWCLLSVSAGAMDSVIGLSLLVIAYRLSNRVTYDSLVKNINI